jgi:hypothetical protein
LGNEWRPWARRWRIPQKYWDAVDLAEFSVKSEPEWWKFLWPLIKKNKPNLLAKLREGKFASRGIRFKSRWASYGKEFRNVLRTLARLRSGGILMP